MAEDPGAQGPPSEEELLAALDRIGVSDVLVQAAATSISIGFRRVSADARDLPQARLAIEALRALEPVLRENGVDEAIVRDLEQARANLQLAYAAAVAETAPSQAAAEGTGDDAAAEVTPDDQASHASEGAPPGEPAADAREGSAPEGPAADDAAVASPADE